MNTYDKIIRGCWSDDGQCGVGLFCFRNDNETILAVPDRWSIVSLDSDLNSSGGEFLWVTSIPGLYSECVCVQSRLCQVTTHVDTTLREWQEEEIFRILSLWDKDLVGDRISVSVGCTDVEDIGTELCDLRDGDSVEVGGEYGSTWVSDHVNDYIFWGT